MEFRYVNSKPATGCSLIKYFELSKIYSRLWGRLGIGQRANRSSELRKIKHNYEKAQYIFNTLYFYRMMTKVNQDRKGQQMRSIQHV